MGYKGLELDHWLSEIMSMTVILEYLDTLERECELIPLRDSPHGEYPKGIFIGRMEDLDIYNPASLKKSLNFRSG